MPSKPITLNDRRNSTTMKVNSPYFARRRLATARCFTANSPVGPRKIGEYCTRKKMFFADGQKTIVFCREIRCRRELHAPTEKVAVQNSAASVTNQRRRATLARSPGAIDSIQKCVATTPIDGAGCCALPSKTLEWPGRTKSRWSAPAPSGCCLDRR
jgi:hypothetical protein